MAIFFHWSQATQDIWQTAFLKENAGSDFRSVDALGDVSEIEHAVVWAPPNGLLKQFPNLKYIFSIGAGVTHITLDPDWPKGVPVVGRGHVLSHHPLGAALSPPLRALSSVSGRKEMVAP